tara:strand:+ start:1490 stop:1816 length:327 start_codon:yes stop_codon:yes gene_type:complete
MANAYEVLGQTTDTATGTALVTCPASTEIVISTLVICNRASSGKTFRVYLRPDDETLADKHYLAYDSTVNANDTVTMTLGITMNASDVLYVYGADANISFSAFGTKIT